MSSSRRTSGEINILAMLDGQSLKPRRFSGLSRAAWYGASAALACVLLGTAAWMVHEQSGGGFENRVPTGPAVVPLEIASDALPNPPLRVDAHPALGAAVVDLPPRAGAGEAPRRDLDAPARDEAHMAGAGAHMVAARAPAAAPAPGVPPAAAPTAAPSTSHDARHHVPPPAVHATPRTASRAAARPAAVQARQAARARHPAALPRPKPAPAAVDTDVALISAIIQHVNQNGELKDGKDCGDKACPSKMPNRP